MVISPASGITNDVKDVFVSSTSPLPAPGYLKPLTSVGNCAHAYISILII